MNSLRSPNPALFQSTPHFMFQVEWDGHVLSFQEVSGLDVEQVMDRRDGTGGVGVIRMPGSRKFSSVTLKKGIATNSREFQDWFQRIGMNTIARKPVVIRLLDESGEAMGAWVLHNAFPTKMIAAGLKLSGDEFAIEVIELAHEGIRNTVR